MTIKFIAVVTIAVLLFDIFAWWQNACTISQQFRQWHEYWPFLPWIFAYTCGVLTGHFFWPQK